jgi:hypothetical protein
VRKLLFALVLWPSLALGQNVNVFPQPNVLGAATASTMAVGGCSLSGNALCVTGGILGSANLFIGSTGTVGFGTRSIILSPADGQVIFKNNAGSTTLFDYGVTTASAFTVTGATLSLNATSPLISGGFSIFTANGTSGSAVSLQVNGVDTGRFIVQSGSTQLTTTAATNIIFGLTGSTIFEQMYASGGIYIGSTPVDPGANNLTIQGTATIKTLSNVATTSAVCYNTGTGLLSFDGTVGTCTVSALRFKNLLGVLNNTNHLDDLRSGIWEYKPELDMGDDHVHIGLLADDVERMDSRCVTYDHKGKLTNYEDRCILAYLVADRQRMKAEIEELKRRIH